MRRRAYCRSVLTLPETEMVELMEVTETMLVEVMVEVTEMRRSPKA